MSRIWKTNAVGTISRLREIIYALLSGTARTEHRATARAAVTVALSGDGAAQHTGTARAAMDVALAGTGTAEHAATARAAVNAALSGEGATQHTGTISGRVFNPPILTLGGAALTLDTAHLTLGDA